MVFRDNEGVALSQDITARVHTILNSIPRLEAFEHVRVENIRARLDKAISEMRDQANIDRNRFEQELIFYIEKLDILEEKVRLKSHCDYFVQTLGGPEANGKKLGFITQEIGREINTIGAKANDAAMQRIVVEMKDELEKLKEQLANVLWKLIPLSDINWCSSADPAGVEKLRSFTISCRCSHKCGFSISATTREQRPNEENGKDYYFMQPETFKAKLKQDEFLEWEEVYEDVFMERWNQK